LLTVLVNVGGVMQMLGGRQAGASAGSSQQQSGNSSGNGQPRQQQGPAPAQSNEPPMDFDDDIPF